MTKLDLPGLVDIHVHLREPGGTHKEDFSSGTAAALAGGFVAVLDMPNNTPPVVDQETLLRKVDLATGKARCDFGFYMGASSDNASRPVAQPHVAALKMYLDDTYGPLRVNSLPTMMAHFQSWPRNKPIATHAEGLSTAIAIGLAQLYDRRLHVCHVRQKAEIELIRKAKERGVGLTCEVTPHHLFLTEDDAERLGPFSVMKPPLGTPEDNHALWDNLDIIDAVASDHAPHTLAEKESDNPPPGVPGLETTLPLLLNAVSEGQLSMEEVVRLLHHGPARVMGLKVPEDAHVEVDPTAVWSIQGAQLFTKCGWTPFEGMTVRGRVTSVRLRGTLVYQEGEVLAPPGFGQPLVLL
jgi:carbamoyl-phosphate synthase/aspartate carbamoyltransferase/dihydroorotase